MGIESHADSLTSLAGPFITIVSIAVAIGVGAILLRTFFGWSRNSQQPVLSVRARVSSKRTDLLTRNHYSGEEHTSYHTKTGYYVTFEVESGDRLEFAIDGVNYGLIEDGDQGKLTFQGTRYLGFERDKNRLSQFG